MQLLFAISVFDKYPSNYLLWYYDHTHLLYIFQYKAFQYIQRSKLQEVLPQKGIFYAEKGKGFLI